MSKVILQRVSDGKYLALECRGAKWVDMQERAFPFDTPEAARKHWDLNVIYKKEGYIGESRITALITDDKIDLQLNFNKALHLMSKLERGCDCEYDYRCGRCQSVLNCLEFVEENT